MTRRRTASTATYSERARRAAAKGPLRKVVGREMVDKLGVGTKIPQDRLECGHLLPPASDIFGERSPERRRCRHCKAAEASDD